MTIYASHDFEDGLLSPFTDEKGLGRVTVVDDPTGAFGGKVARVAYIVPGGTGASSDQSVAWTGDPNVNASPYGQTRWAHAPFYIDNDGTFIPLATRKLIDMQYARVARSILDLQDGVLKLAIQDYANAEQVDTSTTNLPFREKHDLALQIVTNSATGVADGYTRAYLDGVLVCELAGIEFIRNGVNETFTRLDNGQIANNFLQAVCSGRQLTYSASDPAGTEYRYIDSIVISDTSPFGAGQVADHLAITTQPSASTPSGQAHTQQPAGVIRDSANATVTGDTSTVTATLVLESGTGTPRGTLSVTCVAGAFGFTNLGVDSAGGCTAHWQLSRPGLPPISTASFTIAPPPVASVPFRGHRAAIL